MKLDGDLQALIEKVDLENHAEHQFDDNERVLMREAIHASQRRRNNGDEPAREGFKRELDFFVVCLGFGLVAFAVLVMLRFSAQAPLGGPGVFGLAFLVGASGAVFRHYYLHQPNGGKRGLVLTVAALALTLSLIALVAAQAIGGVLGIVLGAVFYRALERYGRRSHPPTSSTVAD